MESEMRRRAAKGEFRVGDTFVIKRKFSQDETHLFGDLTRDYNPVHYDKRWADIKGFEGEICHGLLFGAMICEFGGQVGWLASGMMFKFMRPVYFQDTISCKITLVSCEKNGRAKAEAVFTNQEDRQIAYAELTGFLPVREERKLLDTMLSEGDPFNKLSGLS